MEETLWEHSSTNFIPDEIIFWTFDLEDFSSAEYKKKTERAIILFLSGVDDPNVYL